MSSLIILRIIRTEHMHLANVQVRKVGQAGKIGILALCVLLPTLAMYVT